VRDADSVPKLRVHNLSASVDGFAAGPDQGADHPLGVGGEGLHEWAFKTRSGLAMHGQDGGEAGVDDEFMAAGDTGIGATIMGRNMFGPIRGPWGSDSWRGWWGDKPPYHHDVFVLTHHPRPSLAMGGGTTFHFVVDGIHAALQQAFEAAAGQDVRLGGGPGAIHQYLGAGLIDELHIAIAPVLLGRGERLFAEDPGLPDGYEVTDVVASESVTHVRLAKRSR